MENIKLTQYSHGAGCGCKIAPKVLDSILHSSAIIKGTLPDSKRLLVGNEAKDDAAVYDLEDGTAIISTTDFFMPIVDDAFDFGKIASVNAISDVYAMGGTPLLAIAILGWPIAKLEAAVAARVLDGARQACADAGILLAGGHSIDSPEPIFGLAVTGRVSISQLKKNNTATEGCTLFLTKPLGVGALTTAEKKGILLPEHQRIAPESMMKLNKIGEVFATLPYVYAMTDVTGFGLLGHLTEMCEGSKLSAQIHYAKIPVFTEALHYIELGAVPGGTHRNWDSYGSKIKLHNEAHKLILADPQTSGGLLVAVASGYEEAFKKIAKANGFDLESFGALTSQKEHLIEVL
jgi:selenide,water dikinase